MSTAAAIALVVALATGALVAIQPPVNAQLATYVGAVNAAFISAAISTALLGVLVLATARFSAFSALPGVPALSLAGGVIGALFVGTSLVTVKYLGAGGLVAATISTQLMVAGVLDHFGLFGLERVDLSAARICGFAALVIGTVLVTVR